MKFVAMALTLIVAVPLMAQPEKTAQPQLTEVEKLQLEVAQKNIVIADLQQRLMQLQYAAVAQRTKSDTEALQALRKKIGDSHGGTIMFKPDGSPYLKQQEAAAKKQ